MKIIQEYVSLTPQDPFLVSIFHQVELSYPFHHHKYAYELTMTIGLTGTRMVGDSTEQFSNRDLVLLAPGLPHCWQDHGVRRVTKHKVVVVQFSDMLVPDPLRSTSHYRQILFALDNSKYGLEMVGSCKEEALELIDGLEENNRLETYFGILRVLHMFGNEKAVRKLSSEGYTQPNLKDEAGRLERVLHYIQENYSRKLAIEEVARQAFLSPSAFSHYFKKRTRKSFTDFLMDLRLGKAAQLLHLDEMSVARVGYESGFQNISHFNRSFSKKYKLTPLKFRKQSIH